MSRYVPVVLLVFTIAVSGAASPASAQLATGTITGVVTDDTGAVAGVIVSLAGERLIGGMQTQLTDSEGAYRFERLPPGSYRIFAAQAIAFSLTTPCPMPHAVSAVRTTSRRVRSIPACTSKSNGV